MGMPTDIGIVDTMIGFPAEDFKMYDFIRAQLKDPSAKPIPVIRRLASNPATDR